MSAPIERFLAALTAAGFDPRRSGEGWSSRCPSHDDRSPSLSVAAGDDGRVLIRCHSGCSADAICAALGLRMKDLMADDTGLAKPSSKPRLVATYDYCDANGVLLFQVLRYEPKSFKQRRPDGKGGWTWRKADRQVLYRLQQLLADSTATVYLVEGEKDADRLADLGLIASCNAGGAGKWTAEHSESLQGRHVAVLPDCDDAGRKHADIVARSLAGIAASVRVVELPGLVEKQDVSDWLASGGTKDQLEQLVADTAPWTPAGQPDALGDWNRSVARATGLLVSSEEPRRPKPILRCAADVEVEEIDWLWPGRFARGTVSVVAGKPGQSKSALTCFMASVVSSGRDWPDGSPCARGSVLMMSAEDSVASVIVPRLKSNDADLGRVVFLEGKMLPGKDDDDGLEMGIDLQDLTTLEDALASFEGLSLVVIDPLGSFYGQGIDAYRDNEVRRVLSPIKRLAEKYHVAVVLVVHRRKTLAASADEGMNGSIGVGGISRANWHVLTDPREDRPLGEERRLLLPGKFSSGVAAPGLAYTIVGVPPGARLQFEPDPVTDVSADELLSEQQSGSTKSRTPKVKPTPQSKHDEAVEFLIAKFEVEDRWTWQVLADEWMDVHNGKERTLRRARTYLKLRHRKSKKTGTHHWYPPRVKGPEWHMDETIAGLEDWGNEETMPEDGLPNRLANSVYEIGQPVGQPEADGSLSNNLANSAYDDGQPVGDDNQVNHLAVTVNESGQPADVTSVGLEMEAPVDDGAPPANMIPEQKQALSGTLYDGTGTVIGRSVAVRPSRPADLKEANQLASEPEEDDCLLDWL
jgi:putative DNA primase/helicase